MELQKGGWRAITLAVTRFYLTIFPLALFFCMFSRSRCRASIFRRVRNTIDTQTRVCRYLSTTSDGRSRTSKKRARKGAYGALGGRPMWHGDAWEIRFVIEIVTATYRRSRARGYPELRLRISVLRRGISQLNLKFATVRPPYIRCIVFFTLNFHNLSIFARKQLLISVSRQDLRFYLSYQVFYVRKKSIDLSYLILFNHPSPLLIWLKFLFRFSLEIESLIKYLLKY